MEYLDFENRWLKAGGAERANYSLFLQNLCDLLGVPRPGPTTDSPAQDAYVLERAVAFDDGGGRQSSGRIDLYKRGCFVLDTKQGVSRLEEVLGDYKKRTARDNHNLPSTLDRVELGLAPEKRRRGHAVRGTAKWAQMMEAAREQALRYVRALPASEPRPPFIVVVDVGYCIDLYANFAGVGEGYVPFPDSNGFRIGLPALADGWQREPLRLLFADPQQLDHSRRAAQVTRQLARHLAGLNSQLERAGYASDLVAQFLMRCVFIMFAEDVALIPKKSFSDFLAYYASSDKTRADLPAALQNLWLDMDRGGFSATLRAHVRQFNGKLFHGATAHALAHRAGPADAGRARRGAAGRPAPEQRPGGGPL